MISFSDSDRDAIKNAVRAAEGQTSGEIVPFVASRSSRYAFAAWRAAVVTSLFGAALHLLWVNWLAGWGGGWIHEAPAVILTAVASGVIGYLAVRRIPAVTRFAAGTAAITSAVHSRARNAFLDEEVFDTRERTGILLYVSMLERRIEVVGDAGINSQVSEDDWIDVVALVREGVRNNKAAEGLVAGIERCGALLREKGVEIRPDDTNELPDSLRIDDSL